MNMERLFKMGGLMAVVAALLMSAPAGLSAHDRDNNPPGPAGGRGTNWENPPGPAGGPGASPDRHPRRHHHWCVNHPNHPSCRKR